MEIFSLLLSDHKLYSLHSSITSIILLLWFIISFLGYSFSSNPNLKNKITIFLIFLSVFQEIFDYCNRFFLNDLYVVQIQTDLPLQLCHIAYWFSVICLYFELYNSRYKQFFFNCSYFLGFSGALQGIITVDLTGIYTFYDMLALHLQHSLIILNLLWLIFAYNREFTFSGLFQAFLFTNCTVPFVAVINVFLGSNYMFLCEAPNVNNPLLIGEWPYYLIVLEVIFFVYGFLILIPFLLIKYFNKSK